MRKSLKGISQNKKIAIAAISVFVVSLSMMMFFLGHGNGFENGQANLLHESGGEAAVDTEAAALEQTYRDELGNKSDPVFALYPSGKFKYTGEDFCKLVQKDCDTLKGKLFYNLINSKDLPAFISAHSEVLAKKNKIESMGPYRMISNDHEVIVMFSAAPIFDDDKALESIAFSVKDITEQVEDLDHVKQDVGGNILPDESSDTKPDQAEDDWLKVLYPKFQEMKDSKMAFDKKA
jgi:hypothetical protein